MPRLRKPLRIRGKLKGGRKTLAKYSHDASIFEILPEWVAFPRGPADIRKLVEYAAASNGRVSLTPRAAGTCMSGGAINDSIIVSLENWRRIGKVVDDHIWVQPGVYYRRMEKVTLRSGLLMPSYPASREICMVGGMVGNNAGGEKSLVFGKVEDYVTRLRMVCADGQEYEFGPLSREELDRKKQAPGWEGHLYRTLWHIVSTHSRAIADAKPKVSKNSTGYNLWDVWDGQTFDVTKLITGSQGTLGIITGIEFRLVRAEPLAGMLIMFLPNIKQLGEIINTVLEAKPSSFESFDDHTVKFAMRHFPYFLKTLGWRRFVQLAFGLLPDLWRMRRGIPKLILLAEFAGYNQPQIDQKIDDLAAKLAPYGGSLERARTEKRSRKFWTLRRESFNLLRHNVSGGHTAPFIDDFIVPPPQLPHFLPRLQKILDKYKLTYTIAGHMGDGNFHIIPLMKLQQEADRAKIEPVMLAVNKLVVEHGGSLSGEHNDGLVRGAFLNQMYSKQILGLFRQVKQLFDPDGIFNPHKKIDADWKYSKAHIRRGFD